MTNEELTIFRTKVLKMTQVQMADVVGVSLAAVSSWEKGARRVPKPVIKLLKLAHRYPSIVGEIRTF